MTSGIWVRIFFGILLSAALAGCLQLQKEYPEVKTYALEPAVTGHQKPAASPISLKMNPFTVQAQFVDRFYVYRTGETVYESDFYNQFVASPVYLLQGEVRDWLRHSPLIRYVLDPEDIGTAAHYVLDGRLLEIYGDYRRESEPRAVLSLELTLRRAEGAFGRSTVAFQKTFRQEVPMARISPAELTRGWNEGLGQILADCERHLGEIVQKSKRPEETPKSQKS